MAYQQMAIVYDQLMKTAPYDKWLHFTKQIFKKYEKNIQTIVDLGCGTGEITIKLANEGYQLFGIDYSLDMLTHAEQKSYMNRLPIQWLHQDLRELTGFTNLDAAVSYCDVMNYITSENDLKNVFSRVANSLKESGLFIFDVHSIDYVQSSLINHTFTEVTDEISYIWDCIAGKSLGEMHHALTFFKLEDDKYIRIDEKHYQRTFPISFYKKLLMKSGFTKPDIYTDFSLEKDILKENTERIFFVAQKRSR